MKKKLLFTAILFIAFSSIVKSQANFEDLSLSTDTFWNGSDLQNGFTTGNVYFKNYYDTSYGSWSGFSYSNQTDTVTAGYSNQYSASAGSGNNQSSNFGIYYAGFSGNPIYIKLNNSNNISGFYITNSTYAYLSMLNGDSYAKKFGGTSGDDPDWFKLKIYGYKNDVFIDTVIFYLADFRFSNNTEDYIVKDWTFVDLSSISNADSLTFSLSSSDNGNYGMNTPAYFCIDDLDYSTQINSLSMNNRLLIYPNPAKNIINITESKNSQILIYDIFGKNIISKILISDNETIDVSNLESGTYIVKIIKNDSIISKILIIKW